MKTKTLAVALLLFGAFIAFAQEQAAEGGEENKGAAIEFESINHHFGEIEKTNSVTHVFKFKNVGNDILKIISVKPSCGCTSATPEKTEYQPNETGTIPVTFNPSRFQGDITKTVTVTTNDVKNPVQKLTIKSTIVQDINMRPATLFIPKVQRTETASREITVSSDRLEKLEVTNLEIKPDYFSATQERIDDKTVKLTISVDATKVPEDQNRVNGTLTFDTNSQSTQKNMRTAVTVNLENPISVKPRSTVYFFGTKFGQKREQTLTLVSNDGKDLNLAEATSDLDFVQVELLPSEKSKQSLKVTLLETAQKGRFNGNITIKTNLDEQKSVIIPVRGMVN